MGFLKKLFAADDTLPEELLAALEDVRVLLKRKEYDTALNKLREMRASWPKCGQVHLLEGRAYLLMRDTGAAIAALSKATKLAPSNHEAWYELGNALLANKDTGKAIEAYKHELELHPNPDRSVAVARLIQQEEKEEKAADFLEKSLNKASSSKIAQNFTPTSSATAWFELGSLFLEMRRTSDAIKYLRKAVEAYPRHAEGHFKLSQALQRQGESKQGIEHMKEAARLGHRESQSKLLKHRIEWR